MGIDGRIYPVTAMPEQRAHETGEMDFMDVWYPIQVKQTDKVGRPDIDAFRNRDATRRTKARLLRRLRIQPATLFSRSTASAAQRGREIKPLTVREILDEEIGLRDSTILSMDILERLEQARKLMDILSRVADAAERLHKIIVPALPKLKIPRLRGGSPKQG